ncbi:dihydrolipoyllysine-residue succinyltransferase component of 2-oxoglutarate dehydrogenase complex 2, mitochondrial-like protein [Cinnamomum micranthum f. kanehirae]|uniref:dihydrolipoyllysine-residue succinyltransferase n=1 Tax=Cinnamomum micranthum f. kanehirae TaxID=337451 RepID=A0A3S4P8C2_9MAGN|nr:dihydrolipoyllysine-residue succinyltransferase component of 2-oxoglutarate dehydrogenase complex 2, mitochondrial-like protein [Cinnamomum micranthum f. kanehirae]
MLSLSTKPKARTLPKAGKAEVRPTLAPPMSTLVKPNFEKVRVINALVINIFSLIKVAANVKLITFSLRSKEISEMASRIARLIRRPVSQTFPDIITDKRIWTSSKLQSPYFARWSSQFKEPEGSWIPSENLNLTNYGVGHLLQIMMIPLYNEGDQVDAVVPFMGESITDGTLAAFLKKPGDHVEVDETIAQIETDKVTIDVASPEAGIIEKFVAKEGDTVVPGTKVAVISKSGSSISKAPSTKKSEDVVLPSPPTEKEVVEKKKSKAEASKAEKPKAPSPSPPKPSATEPQLPPKERERRVPMTRLRKRVATRLKDSQNTFAMLTTFNEVDMTNLMKLRSDYKDAFFEKHGVKLGLMSGFVKGAVSGLENQPIVNAVIDGEDIIYREYIDISIAVGTPKGLVVPVIRNADKMNFAEIEKEISTLAKKANDGTISIDEMAGGSFTISNGGVYGSLLSTPIINPPQSAILGMHSTVSRPMVVGGNVVPRPMMYLSLTYDHRLIDGREAVFFLRRIKDVVEDPRRLLLDV